MTGPGAPPSGGVGPLGEEAARLAAAVSDWLGRTFPAADGPDAGGRDGVPADHRHGAGTAAGTPDCRWCPVCRGIAVLRGDVPEVTARLAEAGGAVLTAVRELVQALTEPPPPAPAADGPSNGSAGGSVSRRVERIDLDGPDAAGGGSA